MSNLIGILVYAGIYLVYFAVIGVIALAFYLMNAVGIMTISKKLGLSGGWKGFLPIFDMYQLGKIADEDQARCYPEKKASNWRWWMVIVNAAFFVILLMLLVVAVVIALVGSYVEESTALGVITMVGVILLLLFYVLLLACAVALSVVQYIVLYKLYHVMTGENAVWMLLLSLFVSGASSVILLVLGFSKKFPLYPPTSEEEPVFAPDPEQQTAEQSPAVSFDE